jgi:D-tyrosyl-tRNA(Tyr) deacylase
MKALLQRVDWARVLVDDAVVGSICKGLLVFLGVSKTDTEGDLDVLVRKIPTLRMFEDDAGKMNLSVSDVRGEILVVSQFTLCGNCTKGRRPSFEDAMESVEAARMVREFVHRLRQTGASVQTGRFAADMKVELRNNGPVTFMLDSRDRR